MFDNLKALGELLALAQDDEKRGAMIAQIMTPVHQLAAAVAQLAREQQQLRAELREHQAFVMAVLDALGGDKPDTTAPTALEAPHDGN